MIVGAGGVGWICNTLDSCSQTCCEQLCRRKFFKGATDGEIFSNLCSYISQKHMRAVKGAHFLGAGKVILRRDEMIKRTLMSGEQGYGLNLCIGSKVKSRQQ